MKLRSATEENALLKFHNNRLTKKVDILQTKITEVDLPPLLDTPLIFLPARTILRGLHLVQFWRKSRIVAKEERVAGGDDGTWCKDTRKWYSIDT